MSAPYTPAVMTAALAKELEAADYRMPASWPFPARVEMNLSSKAGWNVKWTDDGPEYTAPDGTKFLRVRRGARAVLVSVSRVTGPQELRVAPGARRPQWVIADTPKGEIPEHLKKYLLKPGQKLSKGEKREAEALAIEPEQTGRGRAGSAVAVLGPRPKPGTAARTEWNRAYRALRADHFKQYRDARKSARPSSSRKTARGAR